MRSKLTTALVVLALIGAALLAVGGSLSGPPKWSPDGLFYQARAMEFRGVDSDRALTQAFGGPLGADLRRVDPTRSGDPTWVAYNSQFYERRVTVPLAAAALTPVAGDRAVLDLSLAGYVATILALFVLLRLRFRLPVATVVTAATIFLPALLQHSTSPLTDSWGLALMTAALASGLLVLERGSRWLIAWTACIAVLAFTRDSTWIPILAALWLVVTMRSRIALAMFGTAVAATIPVLLLFPMPMRPLLAQMLNDAQPVGDPTWGFIVERYPGAILDLAQANGGFVRDGAWYSAIFILTGLISLFAFTRGKRATPSASLLKAAAAAGSLYVIAVPIFSAFRLELVWVPMAAFGLALLTERVLELASATRAIEPRPVVSTRPGA